MMPDYVTSPLLPVRHGFFTRRGGVSTGAYESLNCSLSSADEANHVVENRRRVAEAIGIGSASLIGLTQIHGTRVVAVETPWAPGLGPEADGMVTRVPGLALGIITADCAPVLFADAAACVYGAAHAGWRGACAGILEAMIEGMVALGARRQTIRAAIGPCIAQESYEVGADLRDAVLTATPTAAHHFAAGERAGHWQFDLSRYCVARLQSSGVETAAVHLDTFADETRFFSHRRRVLRGSGATGHQISVIAT